MVTPFDAEGRLDLDAARDAGPLAGGQRQRRAGRGRHHRRGADPHRRREAQPLGRRGRGRHHPGGGRCRHQRHRPLGAPHQGGVASSAWPASSPCARTTTGRRRPGIEAHLRAVAAATDLPLMIYDIPIRTGRKIATATLLRLARDVPNVLALKDAAGNPGETAAVVAEAPAGFEVYSGRRRPDAAAARRRCGRRGRRGHPLDRARPPGAVRRCGPRATSTAPGG